MANGLPTRILKEALFDEGSQTIGDIMTLYFEDRKKEGKAVNGEEKKWKRTLAPMFGHLKPADIKMPVKVDGEERTLSHKYAFERQREGIRRNTIYHELNILRTGINWAAKKQLIPKTDVWLPRRGNPRDTKISFEQFEKLLAECKAPHLRLFVIIAISTGARKTAILELTWDRVDMGRRIIDFRVDRDQENILDSGGRKGRSVVDMNEMVYQALLIAKRWRQTDYVIEYNGNRVKEVHKGLKAAMRRAGGDQKFFGAHMFRHSAATWIADADFDIRKVQRLLGHESFQTTDRIYASHSPGYLKEAVGVIDQIMQNGEPGTIKGKAV